MKQGVGLPALLCLCLGLASTTTLAADRAAAWRAFYDHFDACYAVHGYDPALGETLGDHELGRNERAWRSCVYEGVEKHLVPGSKDPDSFTSLIRDDRILTDKIEAGSTTRKQRDDVVKARVAEIKAAEVESMTAAEKQADAAQQAKDAEFNRRMVDSLRHMRTSGRFF